MIRSLLSKILLSCLFLSFLAVAWGGDMMRKSIVFDKKTPNVFYCPLSKPKGFDKLYVHARPLNKLCEFNGERPPKNHKPDCYQDVDETEHACKEKHRIMKRLPKKALDKLTRMDEKQNNIKD